MIKRWWRALAGRALITSCAKGWPRCVAKALALGAPADARDGAGLSALHWTVFSKDRACAQALIKAGAPLEARCDKGRTPLLLAVARVNFELFEELAEAGADVDAAGTGGIRAIHMAAQFKDPLFCAELIKRKAELEREYGGLRALHYAMGAGSESVSKLLLEAGASLAPSALMGATPMDHARVHDHHALAAMGDALAQSRELESVLETRSTKAPQPGASRSRL